MADDKDKQDRSSERNDPLDKVVINEERISDRDWTEVNKKPGK